MDLSGKNMTLQVIILAMGILFVFSLALITFFITYQRKLFTQQKKQQEQERNYQKELLKTVIESQETERHRVAKELHDDIGAMLTTSKLYFQQISPYSTSLEIEKIISKTNTLFTDMIQNTRRISQDLRPVVLDKLGLYEAILNLVQLINDSGKIKIDYNINTSIVLSKTDELNIYRVIQELTTNTLKHANASVITLNLHTDANNLVIRYSDNGKGLEYASLKHKKGSGLKNIESRLSIMDSGMLYISKAKGLNLIIQIPLLKKGNL